MQLYFPPNFERYLFHLHDGPLRNENDTRFLVLSLSQGRRHVSVLKEGVSSLKNKSSFTLKPSHPWSRSVVVFGLNRHQHHKCQVWRATFFSHNPEKAWTLKSSQPNVKKKKKAIYCLWTWEVCRCIWWSMWRSRGKYVIPVFDTILTSMTRVMEPKCADLFSLNSIEVCFPFIFYYKTSLLLA